MKRTLVALVLLMSIAAPIHAQTIESIQVPFVVLIDDEYAKPHEGGCRFNTERLGYMTFEAAPTPYAPLSDASPGQGRYVTEMQSPIDGQAGCLFEFSLKLGYAESYDFQLIVHTGGSNPNWVLDMGTMTFGDILVAAPDVIIYHLDEGAFANGSAVPLHLQEGADLGTPESVPDYPATIEAQEAEIESLKATIEAIETPEP